MIITTSGSKNMKRKKFMIKLQSIIFKIRKNKKEKNINNKND